MATSQCEVHLRGPLAGSLLEVIRSRFDHVSVSGGDGRVLIVGGVDQAAVRALLTLLWDAGHETLFLRIGDSFE